MVTMKRRRGRKKKEDDGDDDDYVNSNDIDNTSNELGRSLHPPPPSPKKKKNYVTVPRVPSLDKTETDIVQHQLGMM